MDVDIGKFEDISSADSPTCITQLIRALPALTSHHCSRGVHGGFVQRLTEGTYAAHIIEHVALELQSMIGYHVGFGRTRGTGNVGEYTIVFEHEHETVGLRCAALALEIVQNAFCGTLTNVSYVLNELRALTKTHHTPPVQQHIFCGITGGTAAERNEFHDILHKQVAEDQHLQRTATSLTTTTIVGVAPNYILHVGLPYSHSTIAVILDAIPRDVPTRFQDPERAARLLTVIVDALPQSGAVACPADAHYIHDIVHESGRALLKFSAALDSRTRAFRAAQTVIAHLEQEQQIISERRSARSA